MTEVGCTIDLVAAQGDELWLRTVSPQEGTLTLACEESGAVIRLTELRDGIDDSIVPLTSRLSGSPLPISGQLAFEPGTGDHPVPISAAARIAADGVNVIDGVPSTVRVRGKRGGTVSLALTTRAPWVEIKRLEVADGLATIVGEVVTDGPVTGTPVSFEAVDRVDGTSRRLKARFVDGAVRCIVELSSFAFPDHDRVWNASIAFGDQRLRLGRHLDGIPNKGRTVTPTPLVLGRGNMRSVVYLRYTDHNNLVLEASAAADADTLSDPRDTWGEEHAELLGRHIDSASSTGGKARAVRLGGAVQRASARVAGGPRTDVAVGSHDPIHLLLANRHAIGGTVRATVNLANALVECAERPIELVSVYRLEPIDPFPVHGALRARVLVDEPTLDKRDADASGVRAALRRVARELPTRAIHADDPRAYRFTAWTDVQLIRWLRSVHHGTIMTTRSGLTIAAARYARRGVRLVAQQHLPLEAEPPGLRSALVEAYRRCALVCVLTRSEAQAIEDLLGGGPTRVRVIPNPLDAVPPWGPSRPTPTIICGGRLSPVKGTDLAIEAFAAIADRHPEWRLRFVGPARADRLAAARRFALDAGKEDRIEFRPPTPHFDLELATSSICVVPSRHEAFGMVIIEAMRRGLPVVAFDCPSGPREIITDGEDGLLVPAEDTGALATTLDLLISDAGLRERLGRRARRTAERYEPHAVAKCLLDELDLVAAEVDR